MARDVQNGRSVETRRTRRIVFALTALLLLPVLDACRDTQQGDGLATIRKVKEQNPSYGH